MESRMRGNVHVRFGEGDTPYPQGSTVPTPLNVELVDSQEVFGLHANGLTL
jgi:hypothetical protein